MLNELLSRFFQTLSAIHLSKSEHCPQFADLVHSSGALEIYLGNTRVFKLSSREYVDELQRNRVLTWASQCQLRNIEMLQSHRVFEVENGFGFAVHTKLHHLWSGVLPEELFGSLMADPNGTRCHPQLGRILQRRPEGKGDALPNSGSCHPLAPDRPHALIMGLTSGVLKAAAFGQET